MTSRSGLLLVDKSRGVTSHDVVAALRKILDERRIGHAGTLDPMATGLLVVAVGPVTRLLRFAQATTKRYTGLVQLGVATSSLDADGDVVDTQPVPALTTAHVAATAAIVAARPTQIPPMVSALQVDGRRLHAIAREGGDVVRAPRDVTISGFTLSPTTDEAQWIFDVTCSSGTYVRVLLADLAEELGTVGHLAALRRERSGTLDVATAKSVEQIADAVTTGEDPFASPHGLVASLPSVVVSSDQVRALRQGQRVALAPSVPDEVAALSEDGELIGVLVKRGEVWKPDVVLGAFG